MINSSVQEHGNRDAQTESGISVLPFENGVSDQWDEFVLRQRSGSIFHTSAWKRAVERTFPYRACYLYAMRENRITGVAPVFAVSNWILGKALISVPLAVYGGICAEDNGSTYALLAEIQRIGRAGRVDFIELRNRTGPIYSEFHPKSLYVTFTSTLHADMDANIKRLPRDTRYMIRKGQKAGLVAHHGLEQLPSFYELFAISMRRLGTPVFPLKLFENMIEAFRDTVDLMLIYAGDRPITGVFSFLDRDTILPYYAGAAPNAGKLAANDFMYWELMKFAVEKGLQTFDFGRSKVGTGAYAFKSQWDMQTEPLAYQVSLVRRTTVPNFSPANPKFKYATRVWSHLPLRSTMLIGPHVVRWFP